MSELTEHRLDRLEGRLDNHEDGCEKRHIQIEKRLTRLETIIAVVGGGLALLIPAVEIISRYV